MSPSVRNAIVFFAVVVASIYSGCGGRAARPVAEQGESEQPIEASPGPTPTESATPVDSPGTDVPDYDVAADASFAISNLIANGDFRTWPNDARLPESWSHGGGYAPENMPSTIAPYDGDDLRHGNGVEQTWRANDTLESLARVFGQTIAGLDTDTTYELEIRAHNRSDNLIGVSAWEVDGFVPGQADSGQPVRRLALDAVKVTPGDDFNVYRGSFTTEENPVVRLAAKIEGKNPVLPGIVVWDYWKLSPYVEELPNLIRNGNFALWPGDAPLPNSWFFAEAGADVGAACSVDRIDAPDFEGARGLQQEWRVAEGSGELAAAFGQVAIALKPKAVHTLTVRGRNESNTTVLVSAWEVQDYVPNQPDSMVLGDRIRADVVRVPPSTQLDTYSGSFQTGNTGIVLLCTTVEHPTAAAFPVTVIWDSWKLNRTEGSSGSP